LRLALREDFTRCCTSQERRRHNTTPPPTPTDITKALFEFAASERADASSPSEPPKLCGAGEEEVEEEREGVGEALLTEGSVTEGEGEGEGGAPAEDVDVGEGV